MNASKSDNGSSAQLPQLVSLEVKFTPLNKTTRMLAHAQFHIERHISSMDAVGSGVTSRPFFSRQAGLALLDDPKLIETNVHRLGVTEILQGIAQQQLEQARRAAILSIDISSLPHKETRWDRLVRSVSDMKVFNHILLDERDKGGVTYIQREMAPQAMEYPKHWVLAPLTMGLIPTVPVFSAEGLRIKLRRLHKKGWISKREWDARLAFLDQSIERLPTKLTLFDKLHEAALYTTNPEGMLPFIWAAHHGDRMEPEWRECPRCGNHADLWLYGLPFCKVTGKARAREVIDALESLDLFDDEIALRLRCEINGCNMPESAEEVKQAIGRLFARRGMPPQEIQTVLGMIDLDRDMSPEQMREIVRRLAGGRMGLGDSSTSPMGRLTSQLANAIVSGGFLRPGDQDDLQQMLGR